MKKLIFFAVLFLVSNNVFAKTKNHLEEKSLSIKSHVVRMILDANKMFRLELREYAAVYHADEKFLDCLQQSMKENKVVSLTISSQSLIVRECKID